MASTMIAPVDVPAGGVQMEEKNDQIRLKTMGLKNEKSAPQMSGSDKELQQFLVEGYNSDPLVTFPSPGDFKITNPRGSPAMSRIAFQACLVERIGGQAEPAWENFVFELSLQHESSPTEYKALCLFSKGSLSGELFLTETTHDAAKYMSFPSHFKKGDKLICTKQTLVRSKFDFDPEGDRLNDLIHRLGRDLAFVQRNSKSDKSAKEDDTKDKSRKIQQLMSSCRARSRLHSFQRKFQATEEPKDVVKDDLEQYYAQGYSPKIGAFPSLGDFKITNPRGSPAMSRIAFNAVLVERLGDLPRNQDIEDFVFELSLKHASSPKAYKALALFTANSENVLVGELFLFETTPGGANYLSFPSEFQNGGKLTVLSQAIVRSKFDFGSEQRLEDLTDRLMKDLAFVHARMA